MSWERTFASRRTRPRPDRACRHASVNGERRKIAGHDRARSDNASTPDGYAIDDRRPGTDPAVIPDNNAAARDALRPDGLVRPAEHVVLRKDSHSGTQNHVVTKCDSTLTTKERTRPNRTPVARANADSDIGDHTSADEIRSSPDGHVTAERYTVR